MDAFLCMMDDMNKYKKILVIKLGALGDFIQMTGYFTAIRHRWPKAHITLMTGRAFFKLAKQSGCFDDYIEDNRTWNPLDYVRIVRNLASNHYDLIIDLQMQARTKKRYYALARLWTRDPYRWAFLQNGPFSVKYTHKKWPLFWGKTEEDILPLNPEPSSLSFCHANPDVLAKLPSKYVLMIPGCSPAHPYKRWPAASYRALALQLAEQGIYSVVLGTNAEKTEIDLICQDNSKVINFCNQSALSDIPEIAAKALAVVGNDTGPQHMAELVDTPAITLFCDITKNSAIQRANVTNLIKSEISDITVKEVFDTLQSLWHKA